MSIQRLIERTTIIRYKRKENKTMGYFKAGDRVEVIGIYGQLPAYYEEQIEIGSKGTIITVDWYGIDVIFDDLKPYKEPSKNSLNFAPMWDDDKNSEEFIDSDIQGTVILGKENAPRTEVQVKSIKIKDRTIIRDNNGDRLDVEIITDQGKILGSTCRCYKGCHNTWDITNLIGKKFQGMNGLLRYLIVEQKGK